jgi:hypothetical protein
MQREAFEYDKLRPETRDFLLERARLIHGLARRTAESVFEIGRYLSEVKEKLGHGKFIDWITREFGWSERAANLFMAVHRVLVKSANLSDLKEFSHEGIPPKSAKFADLNALKSANLVEVKKLEIEVSALYMIAEASTPEPARLELLRRAKAGERITRAKARVVIGTRKPAPQLILPLGCETLKLPREIHYLDGSGKVAHTPAASAVGWQLDSQAELLRKQIASETSSLDEFNRLRDLVRPRMDADPKLTLAAALEALEAKGAA